MPREGLQQASQRPLAPRHVSECSVSNRSRNESRELSFVACLPRRNLSCRCARASASLRSSQQRPMRNRDRRSRTRRPGRRCAFAIERCRQTTPRTAHSIRAASLRELIDAKRRHLPVPLHGNSLGCSRSGSSRPEAYGSLGKPCRGPASNVKQRMASNISSSDFARFAGSEQRLHFRSERETRRSDSA